MQKSQYFLPTVIYGVYSGIWLWEILNSLKLFSLSIFSWKNIYWEIIISFPLSCYQIHYLLHIDSYHNSQLFMTYQLLPISRKHFLKISETLFLGNCKEMLTLYYMYISNLQLHDSVVYSKFVFKWVHIRPVQLFSGC